jgi:hypothetical protein
MIRLRTGTVVAVAAERPGAVELVVEVEGARGSALAYPGIVGPAGPGDRVLLNTTAVDLGLGTGGMHLVVAVEGVDETEADGPGHTMKARYTPSQVKVLSVEEADSPHRAAVAGDGRLDGTPVVWIPLHSMLGPAVAGARAAGAGRVAWVMTDGAALPAALSRLSSELRASGLLDAVVSSGQAFGGDLESISVFSGLLAARGVVGADVIVVGDGPGSSGTDTVWGSTHLASAMSMNAAAVLAGRPVAALRISFADPRERHLAVSHHSQTALSRVAMTDVDVAVPAIEDEARRDAVWRSLESAGVAALHRLTEVDGRPALDLLADHGIAMESMGRSFADDPEFFLAAGAAGVLAGGMVAGG